MTLRTSTKGKTKPKPDPKTGAPDDTQDGDVAFINSMLALRPPLSDIQQAAFRSRFSDAQCDELGSRTKSGPVLQEAKSWATQMQKTLAQPHDGLRYSEDRYTFLLLCIRDLALAREAQRIAQGSVGAVRKQGERARNAALMARDDLLEMLTEMAGGVETETERLDTARGTTKKDPDLVVSVRALANLAEDWLKRTSEIDRALVAATGITTAHVQAARQSANALEQATGERTKEGKLEPRDVPAVNRAEGRVVREMSVLMRAVEKAHQRNKLIRKLVPGPATRRVLLNIRPAEISGEPAKSDAPTAAKPE